MGPEAGAERVPGVVTLLLHEEVHGLRQALVVAHPETLLGTLDLPLPVDEERRLKRG